MIDKRGAKVLNGIVSVLCALILLFGAFSHIAYGRTVMSTVAEYFLSSQKIHDEDVSAYLQSVTENGEAPYTADPSAFDKKLTKESFDGMQVLYVNKEADYDAVVFYIHGGYYVHQISADHIRMMNRIANETDAMLVMPLYPLAPFHTVEDSFDTMVGLFEKIQNENADKKIILMGDSAGGGYSLALAEGLTKRQLKQPDELILLSPWVDVTMSNPDLEKYVNIDPMLTVTMGKMSGEAWAGKLPMEDWHVSPINGDLSQLKNVTIFVGTRELFYPDDTLLYEKLKNNENTELIIGTGLNHVYPAFPTLEGRIAVDQIVEKIKR